MTNMDDRYRRHATFVPVAVGPGCHAKLAPAAAALSAVGLAVSGGAGRRDAPVMTCVLRYARARAANGPLRCWHCHSRAVHLIFSGQARILALAPRPLSSVRLL